MFSALPDMLGGAAFALLVNNGDRWCWTSLGEQVYVVLNTDLSKYLSSPLDIQRVDRDNPIQKVIQLFSNLEAEKVFWHLFLLLLWNNYNKNEKLSPT